MNILSRGPCAGGELVGNGMVVMVLHICDSSHASFEVGKTSMDNKERMEEIKAVRSAHQWHGSSLTMG